MASGSAASPSARAVDAVITSSAIKARMTSGATLASTAELFTRVQTAGDFRADFDLNGMAIAFEAVIDAAPGRLANPAFDIDEYAREEVTIFERAV